MSEDIQFTLFYILLCICIIYPPNEVISSGLTIPDLFSSILGIEFQELVMYHIRRSSLMLLIYSLLPMGYLFGLSILGYKAEIASLYTTEFSLKHLLALTAVILPLLALYEIRNWSRDSWKHHPIAANISKFCNSDSDWKAVASSINAEYRSVDKFCMQTSPITKIVATENWILKITPLHINLCHQTDANLVVKESDTYHSLNNLGTVQYITIEVKSSRSNVDPFTIRIKGLDFQNLQDRISRTISIPAHVKFHKTLIDRFIDAFKDCIKNNPQYSTTLALENCLACMQTLANVKLQKTCADDDLNINNCGNCNCKPMWCVECMARWFASKQDEHRPETWLSSKCTCPMCRASFCILDVCPLPNFE